MIYRARCSLLAGSSSLPRSRYLKWVEKLRFASQLRETKLVRWVDSEELDVDHREGEKTITIMTANKYLLQEHSDILLGILKETLSSYLSVG
jgi:hypothetical protein